MTIEVGRPAPAFTLPDSDGKAVSLEDFRGRHVVVYFYPRDDTPGCTKQACGFRDLWQQIRALNAVILGVSPDDGVSHRRFRDAFQLPFPLLCDPDKTVMSAYRAYGEKTLYGKTTVGVIRSAVWVGPDGEVRKHWKRVADAAKHPARVLELLRQAAV